MKIHSDTLTDQDILNAAPRSTHFVEFEEAGSRSRKRAWNVRLSGSSKYSMQGVEGKAATWDEWGIFIAALFKFDPEAKIGWYKSYDHFIEFTTEERDRCAQYRPDLGRTAPWLDDEKKGNYA